jgi:hypothetical protein
MTAKKKPPARPKKTERGAQKSTKTGSEKDSLAEELRSLIPRLDEEGLRFLIEQAEVHLYNMQVDELNDTLTRNAEAEKRTGKKTASKSPAKKTKGEMRIAASETGSSIYIVYNEKWVMFSQDEMVRLVKIVNGPGADLEIRERLFNWFDKERGDIFETIPIADKFDERLKKVAALIKKSFKVKYRKDPRTNKMPCILF